MSFHQDTFHQENQMTKLGNKAGRLIQELWEVIYVLERKKILDLGGKTATIGKEQGFIIQQLLDRFAYELARTNDYDFFMCLDGYGVINEESYPHNPKP